MNWFVREFGTPKKIHGQFWGGMSVSDVDALIRNRTIIRIELPDLEEVHVRFLCYEVKYTDSEGLTGVVLVELQKEDTE